MRSLKFLLTFIVIPCILIFSILEVGVRISGNWGNLPYSIQKGDFNFEWGWQMEGSYFAFPPNRDVHIECQEFRYDYSINSLGVREKEVDTTDSSAIRLFIYGDSFAEGNGAAYDSTWPRRVEELLHASGRDATVYMTGVSGSDPFYAYSALNHRLKGLAPTHFIVTINDSDFDNYAIRGGFSRFRKGGVTKYNDPPSIYLPYKYSHLVRMLAHQFLEYDPYLVKAPNSEKNRGIAADSLAMAMSMIHDLCLSHDIDFMAVIHPTPHEVCFASESHSSDVRVFEGAGLDFPAVLLFDRLDAVLDQENCYDYCWRIDSHFNGRGYRMFGEQVFEAITEGYPAFFDTKTAVPGPSGKTTNE